MSPIIRYEQDEEFSKPTYVVPRSVTSMHQYPRWGWPSDPVYLSGDATTDEKQDYLTGILVGSLIIFMVFVVWSLILVALKCCDRRRVGCGSGRLPYKPAPPASMVLSRSNGGSKREKRKERSVKNNTGRSQSRRDTSTATAAEDDDQIPASVRKWLDSQEQKEETEIEEAESEIMKSARTSGIMMAARAVSYREDRNASIKPIQQPPSPPPEQASEADEYEYGDDDHFHDDDAEAQVDEEADDAESDGQHTGSTYNAQNISEEERQRRYQQQQSESREYTASMKKFDRRVRIIRAIFLLAGVGILVSTALFYAKGLMGVKNSLEDTQATLAYGESVLENVHNLTSSYVDMRKDTQEEAANMRYTTEEFCPTNALDALDLNPEQTARLEQTLSDVRTSLGNLNDMLTNEFETLEKDLTTMIDDVTAANDAIDNAYPFLWAGAGAVGAQIVIVICLMAEVIMASRGRKIGGQCGKCMRNVILLPLFFIFTILSWLFASLFLLAAISGSDFCVNPDRNTLTLLGGMGYSTVLGDYVAYFVTCVDTDKPVEIPKEADLVYDALGALHNFTDYLSSEEAVAEDICTPVGADLVRSLSEIVHRELHGVSLLFNGIIEFMQCSTFNPLYATAAYQALCINGVDGLNWMFGTQLAVAICSMTMITLRAARHEGDEMETVRDLRRESSRKMNIGAKPAPWEAAAVAAFVADDREVTQKQHSSGEENVEYVFPCEEEDEAATEGDQGEQMVDESAHGDVLYHDGPYEGEEGQDNWDESDSAIEHFDHEGEQDDWLAADVGDDPEMYYDDEGGEEPYHDEPYDDVSGDGHRGVINENLGGIETQKDSHFDVLETLTSEQVEAIEKLGVQQAESGHKYEQDELEVKLLSVPGLSVDQINAVIDLELLTRAT